MNTIEQFKHDLGNGIWSHTKQLLKPMMMPTLITGVVSLIVCYLAYLFIKPILPPEIFEMGAIESPEEVTELMLLITDSIMENQWAFMGRMFVITLLFTVISAVYYNVALRLSKQIVEGDDENPTADMSNLFGKSFTNLLVYGLILAIISTGLTLVENMFQTISPVLATVANLGLQILVLRFFAGRAWIVMGGQNAIDGLKLSWEKITFTRALKLFLLIMVGAILLMLALALVFGLSMFLGKAGVFIFLVVLIVVAYICSIVGVSGLSASFYRYVDIEYEDSDSESDPTNHLLDTEQ